jgi:hypothetical protein
MSPMTEAPLPGAIAVKIRLMDDGVRAIDEEAQRTE